MAATDAAPAPARPVRPASPVLALLAAYSWPAVRLHPWRHAAALASVVLGVALAYAVHLINNAALDEFASAVRSASGQPDLSLLGVQGRVDENLYPWLASRPETATASPVIEALAVAQAGGGAPVPIRLVGVDALRVAAVAPDLLPRLAEGQDRLALFAPRTAFLNASAQQALGPAAAAGMRLGLPSGAQAAIHVAGQVHASGSPLAVMDIGALQDLLGLQGQLTRVDLRLAEGVTARAMQDAWPAPPGTLWRQPGDDRQRASNLSRAYRVNLTVLALVALFTGAFLVYSVLSLSVARRSAQLALLGVLGLTARERLRLILAESAVIGAAGSVAGLLAGSGLAGLALWLFGGDLGGGYFDNTASRSWRWPWQTGAAAAFGLLGAAAALAGGWWPARQAAALPPALALKGLGAARPRGAGRAAAWGPAGLILLALGLCAVPPVGVGAGSGGGVPLGAYLAIALLLIGGIAWLPLAIRLAGDHVAPRLAGWLLPMLAVERARHAQHAAAVAVSGVVAALALSVALTVMVASFRDSVAQWLDVVLPAELYLRIDRDLAPQAAFSAAQLDAVRTLGGIARVAATRQIDLQLDPARAPVALLARDFAAGASPAQRAAATLPLVGRLVPAPPGTVPVYVSESAAELYRIAPGSRMPAGWLSPSAPRPAAARSPSAPDFFVSGIWRDYARQQGSIAMERTDYLRLTGDAAVDDIAIWLAPSHAGRPAELQQAVRDALRAQGWRQSDQALAFSSVAQLRATSLRIFDRSFAVTYWLQAVAIGIGLFGVAASFSAQVLARTKEFGMLQHMGFTRAQILRLAASEGAAWTAIGSLAGLGLGLGVSVILVKVVNPQSFHWTMDMSLPAARLALLCAAVVAVGAATAWLAARAAAGRGAVLAVKEDW